MTLRTEIKTEKTGCFVSGILKQPMVKLDISTSCGSIPQINSKGSKVQGGREHGSRLSKEVRGKAVRQNPAGVSPKERPEASYVSPFVNRNFSGFLFGRVSHHYA